MKGPLFLMLLSIVCFPLSAQSEVLREIELTDGSRIQAAVLSLSGGMYTLRSESMGEIEIPAEKVKTIRTAGTADTPVASPDAAVGVNSQASNMQLSFMQDPANADKILSLQDDPLVQNILNDEETMRAVRAGDIGSLLANPKIRELMGHPTIQGFSQQHGK